MAYLGTGIPMKIAGIIFESLAKPGGYEIFTYNLHAALAGLGHDVTLYLPSREVANWRSFYRSMPFAVLPLAKGTHFLLKRAPGRLQSHLVREQRRHGYHVWQVMGAWPEGLVSEGLKGLAPRVLRSYGEDIQVDESLGYGLRRDPARDRAVRRIVADMDACVAMTDSLARLFAELGAPAERIVPIPNGVDHERLSRPRDRAAIRKGLKVSKHIPLLLTVGRNHPKKGFASIPHMAAELLERGHAFIWLVVGGGTETLVPEIDRLGLAGVVRPLPPLSVSGKDFDPGRIQLPVEGLVDLYAAADIFVLPSRLEGFSRVIAEGLAAGLPAVTTDAPGCGEVVPRGAGLVSPVDDIEAMVHNLGILIADADQRDRMSQTARHAAEAFDWKQVAARYEALYRRLTGQ